MVTDWKLVPVNHRGHKHWSHNCNLNKCWMIRVPSQSLPKGFGRKYCRYLTELHVSTWWLIENLYLQWIVGSTKVDLICNLKKGWMTGPISRVFQCILIGITLDHPSFTELHNMDTNRYLEMWIIGSTNIDLISAVLQVGMVGVQPENPSTRSWQESGLAIQVARFNMVAVWTCSPINVTVTEHWSHHSTQFR